MKIVLLLYFHTYSTNHKENSREQRVPVIFVTALTAGSVA